MCADLPEGMEPSGLAPFQTNGGTAGHPDKALPFSLELPLPDSGAVTRVHLLGAFALHAEDEPVGTVGLSLQSAGPPILLANGSHYRDASTFGPVSFSPGDGTSLQTVGEAELGERTCRLDLLSLDLGPGGGPALRLRDLGTPASFVILDAWAEVAPSAGCPFHPQSGGIALSDVAAIVRVGDRVRFSQALEQLEASLQRTEDLDEARGEALTFLAVVTASTLELGGSKAMHRVQLDAAREMEGMRSVADIAEAVRRFVRRIVPQMLESGTQTSGLMNQALDYIDRNYAKRLTDREVASQVGLSTSHFRYLFRQTTGQPFHKYVVAVRLEKARQMLVEQGLPVSAVAEAVGFTGLSHFSRAFSQRFSVTPNALRRAAS